MLAPRISLRYLFSKKSHSAVNIISYVSIAGVALATAAMVIVLSVFNGFSEFAETKFSRFDPDLMIQATKGKVISGADSMASALLAVEGVAAASPIIEELAFATAGERQMPVVMRGIAPESRMHTSLSRIMIDGQPLLSDASESDDSTTAFTYALSSVGVANGLRTTPSYPNIVRLYEPKRTGRINPSSPMTSFRADSMLISGVYQVEQQEYDTDMLIVPLSTARRLLDYTDEASMIEVSVACGNDVRRVKAAIAAILPADIAVKDRLEQQDEAFRMISIEKWVTLAMLIFIMVIASFNILSTMSMMIVEKQPNHSILLAMGAPLNMISRVYAWLSFQITAAGGILGLGLGLGLSLVQQFGGLIKLNAADPSAMSITVYPVRVEAVDILVVAAIVAAVGGMVSLLMYRTTARD